MLYLKRIDGFKARGIIKVEKINDKYKFIYRLKKDKILENALFNIIYPFFQNYYFLNSFPLNRNLSYFLLLNLVFIFLLFIFFL